MTTPTLRELARAIDHALDPIARSLDGEARAAVARDAFKMLVVIPILVIGGSSEDPWYKTDDSLLDVFRVREALFDARKALTGRDAAAPAWPAMLDQVDAFVEALLAKSRLTHRAARRLARQLQALRAELRVLTDGAAP